MAAVLACLPVAHAGLYTGWRQIDEFEVLVAASAAGWCLARWCHHLLHHGGRRPALPGHPMAWALLLLWAAWGVFQGGRHIDAAVIIPWHSGWWWADHEGAAAPWRTLRASVWPVLALWLLAPWLTHPRTLTCWRWAMCAGLLLVGLCVGWERHAMVGVWDLSTPYRTSGPFWDMSLGGGAIDAYLALAMPWAWWSLWLSRSHGARCAWGGLVALGIYTVVTTFSRGVLVASAIGVLWMHWLAVRPGWPRLDSGQRQSYGAISAALLIWWLALVLFAGFAVSRLQQTSEDAVGRWRHWGQQLMLLDSVRQRLLGLGLAQVPAAYSASSSQAEMAGRARWAPAGAGLPAHLVLSGPVTRPDLAGVFGLTQSVQGVRVEPDRFELTAQSTHDLMLRVSRCEQWLLQPRRCRLLEIPWVHAEQAQTRQWRWPAASEPSLLDAGDAWAPRRVGISVLTPGADIRVFSVKWMTGQTELPLRNEQFTEGLSGWWPVATAHFVPWHSDNLYLEIALERGIVGLMIFLVLFGWSLRVGGAAPRAGLHAALVAMAALGVLISVHEFPRVAFLLHFLLGWTLLLGSARRKGTA